MNFTHLLKVIKHFVLCCICTHECNLNKKINIYEETAILLDTLTLFLGLFLFMLLALYRWAAPSLLWSVSNLLQCTQKIKIKKITCITAGFSGNNIRVMWPKCTNCYITSQ